MKNDLKKEEVVGSREEFRRYLRAGGQFFEAFSHLHDELDAYLNCWEGIDERVGGSLMCGFAEEFERLAVKLKDVTHELRGINERIDELKGPMN